MKYSTSPNLGQSEIAPKEHDLLNKTAAFTCTELTRIFKSYEAQAAACFHQAEKGPECNRFVYPKVLFKDLIGDLEELAALTENALLYERGFISRGRRDA